MVTLFHNKRFAKLSLTTFVLINTLPFSAMAENWRLIDNFDNNQLAGWHKSDPDNRTDPFVDSPQVLELRSVKGNLALLKKPAQEGIVGNRKALAYKALPMAIEQNQIATVYTRLMVEQFPNNHSFGLSNLSPEQIDKQSYNAFEPMLRVTDKAESNGLKNTGTLMVSAGHKKYDNIQNPHTSKNAKPLESGNWYQLWFVVDNTSAESGGQSFDLYVQGGEFSEQTKVYSGAKFRMARHQTLSYFITIANTGPKKQPYGNGGLFFDDIYMAQGTVLSQPN